MHPAGRASRWQWDSLLGLAGIDSADARHAGRADAAASQRELSPTPASPLDRAPSSGIGLRHRRNSRALEWRCPQEEETSLRSPRLCKLSLSLIVVMAAVFASAGVAKADKVLLYGPSVF